MAYNSDLEMVTPAFSANYVAIVMASSDAYSDFLLIALASIKHNASAMKNYDVVIMSDGISNEKQMLIRQQIAATNIALRFINVKHLLDQVELRTEWHITKTSYLRLISIDLMKAYQKMIYLDCDIVVNCDLAQLFDVDINDYLIAAVVDTIMCGWCNMDDENGCSQRTYLNDELQIYDPCTYFNAGVMLINICEFLRRGITGEYLIGLAEKKQWRWFDQDVLNACTKGNVKYLDQSWNVEVHGYWKEQEISEFYMPDAMYLLYKEAIINPKIIHYAGNSNPIKEPTVDRCDLFWKYSRMTSVFPRLHGAMLKEQFERVQKSFQNRKVSVHDDCLCFHDNIIWNNIFRRFRK